MVFISNGLVVSDDDPRARAFHERRLVSESPASPYITMEQRAKRFYSSPARPHSLSSLPRSRSKSPGRRAALRSALFSVPTVVIAGVTIPPAVYLFACFLVYVLGLIGVVGLLLAFNYFRWHSAQLAAQVARENQEKEKKQAEEKIIENRRFVGKLQKNRGNTIHSIWEIPQETGD